MVHFVTKFCTTFGENKRWQKEIIVNQLLSMSHRLFMSWASALWGYPRIFGQALLKRRFTIEILRQMFLEVCSVVKMYIPKNVSEYKDGVYDKKAWCQWWGEVCFVQNFLILFDWSGSKGTQLRIPIKKTLPYPSNLLENRNQAKKYNMVLWIIIQNRFSI